MHNLYSHLSKFSNQLQEFVWKADPQKQAIITNWMELTVFGSSLILIFPPCNRIGIYQISQIKKQKLFANWFL